MNRKLKLDELGRMTNEEFHDSTKNEIVVVLDNIRSLNNVGTFFRTGDAFRIEELILTGITAQPPHREIRKTAIGATKSVQWSYFENTLDAVNQLKERGFKIYSVEQTENSISLEKFNENGKIALIFGNEVDGVQQAVINASYGTIEIPQFGTKHSLNVSVSAGIVLWQAMQNRLVD